MKRWLLSICMVLCIGVLTFSLRINANQDINVDYPYKGIPTEKELKGKSEAEIEFIFQEISLKQQAAVEASGKIHNTLFSMNKDGIWEYPDEYGGMFIDEFILHVLLTDVSDAMIE